MFSQGDRFELHIDRLSVGGRGVGRKDGIVVFVDLVAPNEDVEVEVTFVKKNLVEAKLVRVVEPSCYRIDPPCVHFKEGCGGCSWQHIGYDAQLKAKRELVAEALRKFSGFKDVALEPTVPSPLAFRYRNRIQVHVQGSTVGFHARGSHRIVDVKDCLITEEPLVKKIQEIRQGKVPGDRIQIYRSQENEVLAENAEEQSSLAFSQVNSSQNTQLIHAVLDQAQKTSQRSSTPSVILDLYSGSGNFTFPLAELFPQAKVTGVELNSPAVQRGNDVAKQQNKLVHFERAKVEEFLKRWKPPGAQYLILIDPPRTGCDPAAIKILKDLKPTCLIYISCHPVTLARDLKPFSEAGWTINFAQPYDMFPQTDHVETLVVLDPPNVSVN
jgi:23S rRNA (uracil1939-C5)-methyltransferase